MVFSFISFSVVWIACVFYLYSLETEMSVCANTNTCVAAKKWRITSDGKALEHVLLYSFAERSFSWFLTGYTDTVHEMESRLYFGMGCRVILFQRQTVQMPFEVIARLSVWVPKWITKWHKSNSIAFSSIRWKWHCSFFLLSFEYELKCYTGQCSIFLISFLNLGLAHKWPKKRASIVANKRWNNNADTVMSSGE